MVEAKYYKAKKAKIYNPDSVEYSTLDAIISEQYVAFSYDLYLFSFNLEATKENMDSMDDIYGENEMDDEDESFENKYAGPMRFHALTEKNPILMELSRLGLEQVEELDIYANISDFTNKTRVAPKEGDYILISYLKKKVKENKFYKIGNVVPADEFNGRFMNYHIFSEQTASAELPDEIQEYSKLK